MCEQVTLLLYLLVDRLGVGCGVGMAVYSLLKVCEEH